MNFSAHDIGFLSASGSATIFDQHVDGLAVSPHSVPNNGDQRQFNFFANAGNYDMRFHYAREDDAGILEISVDGVVLGNIDTYNAVPSAASITFPNVTLTDGEHAVVFTVTGKNAASSNYYTVLGWCSIVPR